MYKYKAKVVDIYDADTLTLEIQLGFYITMVQKVRLIGIDTPELRTKDLREKELGYKARDSLRDLILEKEVEIETTKQGKYGRYLVNIFYDDININNELIRLGYAKPYFGGKKSKNWFDDI